MKVVVLLRECHETIIERTSRCLCECHIQDSGHVTPEEIRHTIEELYGLTLTSVQERDAGPMLSWGERMARERFAAGCCLHEMQSVVNTLESTLWQTILEELEPDAFAEAIGFVSTALGMAKDALAREWVTLASKRRTHSLDMKTLFSGTASPALPEE